MENMTYSLRPTALLLPCLFYDLPSDVLYRIALLASVMANGVRSPTVARLPHSRTKRMHPNRRARELPT